MERKIRWGIMGAGTIVQRWINGARQFDDMEILAVASRTRESAERAAVSYGIPYVMSYEEMAESTDIDVVYIPVVNTAHKRLAILAMEHGKAVLVEKPAAVNEAELDEMITCARKNHVFFMEAMWTRFFPLMKKIREQATEDGIGEIRAIQAAFSFRVPGEMKEHRALNPELAGGGLLDVGVYDLHFVQAILGKNPVELTGCAAIDSDAYHIRVDEQAMCIAKYDRGELAGLSCGVRTEMVDSAVIYGTKGRIEVPVFWKPTKMQVIRDGETSTVELPVPQRKEGYMDEGFQYEIAHVNQCLREGREESPVMTWERSRDIIRQCDHLRAQWGLKYPFE